MRNLTIEELLIAVKENKKEIGTMIFDNKSKIKENKMIERRLKDKMAIWNERVQPLLERRSMPRKDIMREYYKQSEIVKLRVLECIQKL